MKASSSAASMLKTRAGAGIDRRWRASASARPIATPSVKNRIGTSRWAAKLQSPSPMNTPSRTVLPLMWATNRPARVRNPTAST
jgi:hypothetical protein